MLYEGYPPRLLLAACCCLASLGTCGHLLTVYLALSPPASTHTLLSQQFVETLEDHAKNCEAQGKYVEAEVARNRLDELKMHELNRRKEAMRARHIAERLGIEEAHMLEFRQFNLVWDKKSAAYEENAADLIMEMKERHAAELKEFQQRLLAQASVPRRSKELLNLRRVQDSLAKAKRYEEAALMKNKADELMTWEEEKWHNEIQAAMYGKELRFKEKLNAELVALKRRIQQGKAEMKRQRQHELELLLRRYQNVKRELDRTQRMDRVSFQKVYKVQTASIAAAAARRGGK